MPSRWSNGEGHVGIEGLEHIDVGLPGVGEDGMPRRNEQRKPGTTRGSPSLDFSNFVWCIGAKNQRKILCHNNFSLILERADADRVYAAPVRI